MEKGFDEYSRSTCLKTNLITTGFFILTFIVIGIVDNVLLKKSLTISSDLIAILKIVFINMFILIVYNELVILLMKIYRNLGNNIKALLGLTICNIITAAVIYTLINIVLSGIYIISVIVIDSLIFGVRYGLILYREKKVE